MRDIVRVYDNILELMTNVKDGRNSVIEDDKKHELKYFPSNAKHIRELAKTEKSKVKQEFDDGVADIGALISKYETDAKVSYSSFASLRFPTVTICEEFQKFKSRESHLLHELDKFQRTFMKSHGELKSWTSETKGEFEKEREQEQETERQIHEFAVNFHQQIQEQQNGQYYIPLDAVTSFTDTNFRSNSGIDPKSARDFYDVLLDSIVTDAEAMGMPKTGVKKFKYLLKTGKLVGKNLVPKGAEVSYNTVLKEASKHNQLVAGICFKG